MNDYKVFFLSIGVIFLCLQSQAQTFTEVSSAAGIYDGFGIPLSTVFGGPISFSDFNSDGWDDITIGTMAGQPMSFYQNNGNGTFTKLSSLVPNTCDQKQSLWVDLDNDGDKDLFITCYDGGNSLYENIGNLSFVNRTFGSGLATGNNIKTISCTVADINHDSFLDIFIGNYTVENGELQSDKCFLNDASSGFVFNDISNAIGLSNTESPTYAASFVDINQDRLPDLQVSIDKSWKNILFKNLNNGNLANIAASSGTDIIVDAMSSTWGDIDGDGDLDHYVTNNISGNIMLRNNGDETFTDISTFSNTKINQLSWGANFLDVENDGDLDLYNCVFLYTNRLLINNGNGSFQDNLTTSGGLDGVDIGKSYSNAIGDFNNDGYPDIAVSNLDEEQFKLFRNENGSANNHWVKIELKGVISNIDGIGAWIKAYADGDMYARYVQCGTGFQAQNSDYPLIGIGQNTVLDSLVISWPSGVIDKYNNVPADQFINLLEGASPNSYTQSLVPASSALIDLTHSVARNWMELLLASIRNDFARPTVHARNLYHSSVAMYDAWAAYQSVSLPFFLNNTIDGYTFPFSGVAPGGQVEQEEAISYAMYGLLRHRFQNSPAAAHVFPEYDFYMQNLGYDINNISTNYLTGGPAELGNYIAQQIIAFGEQDGSNEQNDYANLHYSPVNAPLIMDNPGNPDIDSLNRWQPLTLDVFIDQAGNAIPVNTPDFLSPEWGQVSSFALQSSQLSVKQRNGNNYHVYCDPGAPPRSGSSDDLYQWGFGLVSIWSSHLDATDNTIWDISPASIGNISSYPTSFTDYHTFYDLINGGDSSVGYSQNPKTGQPYSAQLVKRADYARVLAEFWADGPDSETPPGHWFSILNYVSDHAFFEKKYQGMSFILSDLEWDVKAYFSLGGAMHDAAVVAWGLKGWYDYIRPVSAIRAMAELGQSSAPGLASYHSEGIELESGFIELVLAGDPLLGDNNEHYGKIKLKAWKGPDYILDPVNDEAGVDWILAENWWPYQRPSFVTPPFAGYISGHSTFSRAAAEVLTRLTGDAFFPGGIGEFAVEKDEFLVFEDGPSQDFTLQWATYRDASDQCSLSRIWGGIHPPADDIPGRLIGIKVGNTAFDLARNYILGSNCQSGVVSENGVPIPNAYYGANIINSSGQVISPDVRFEASQEINLMQGFSVHVGANFLANIDGCP